MAISVKRLGSRRGHFARPPHSKCDNFWSRMSWETLLKAKSNFFYFFENILIFWNLNNWCQCQWLQQASLHVEVTEWKLAPSFCTYRAPNNSASEWGSQNPAKRIWKTTPKIVCSRAIIIFSCTGTVPRLDLDPQLLAGAHLVNYLSAR